MEIKELLPNRKLSQGLRIIVIVLSIFALAAEVLPEWEAKSIVIPTLVLAISICFFEIIKDQNFTKKS
jgi:hypothetical protein